MWYDLVLGAEGRKEVLCPLPSQRFNCFCFWLLPSPATHREQWQKQGGDLGLRKQGSCTALLSGVRTISWGLEVKRGANTCWVPAGFCGGCGVESGVPLPLQAQLHNNAHLQHSPICTRILKTPSALDLLVCLGGKPLWCPHPSAPQ